MLFYILHLCLCQCWRCRWEEWSVQVPGGSSPSQSKPSSAQGPPPAFVGAPTPSGSLTAILAAAAPPCMWAGPSSWLVQRKGSGAGGLRRVAWWRTAPPWPSSGGNTGAPNWGASGGRTRGAAARQNPPTTTSTTTTGNKQSPSLGTSPLTCWLRKTRSLAVWTHTLWTWLILRPQWCCTHTLTQTLRSNPQRQPPRQLYPFWCALLKVLDEKQKPQGDNRKSFYNPLSGYSAKREKLQEKCSFFTVSPEGFRRNRPDFASEKLHNTHKQNTCYVMFKHLSKNVKKHTFLVLSFILEGKGQLSMIKIF